ncbi:MAG: PstS family phosphate ABC transporter substrate-binding protein [Flavobacteriales bacterium]
MKRSNIPVFLTLTFLLASCGGSRKRIKIDGSSTVYPISEAVVEAYRKEAPKTSITIGASGTGGGFKKFGRGATDINDASRPITQEEKKLCQKNGIAYKELKVAYDGMAVCVNPENDWLDTISTKELKKIWEPGAEKKVKKWSDIRKEWPDKKIRLYGPGVQSGTYDYFTKVIVGESGASRGDYTSSEDDNTLVQGVQGEKYSLGFFGFSYYQENKDKLKLVAVDDGNGGVHPSKKTIEDRSYTPLTRPLYIYVRKASAKKQYVRDFVKFYLKEASNIVQDAGYFPMSDKAYKKELQSFKAWSSDLKSEKQGEKG